MPLEPTPPEELQSPDGQPLINPDVYYKRIIYPQENGVLGIICPSPECQSLDILIEMDVPEGAPYAIVDVEDIPTDRTYRNSWTFEED